MNKKISQDKDKIQDSRFELSREELLLPETLVSRRQI